MNSRRSVAVPQAPTPDFERPQRLAALTLTCELARMGSDAPVAATPGPRAVPAQPTLPPGISIDVHQPSDQPAFARTTAGRKGWVAVVGSPIAPSASSVDSIMRQAADGEIDSAESALCTLEGVFTAFRCDLRTGTVSITTDPLGLQPTYLAEHAGSIWCSTRIGDVIHGAQLPSEPDPAGIGALLVLGHLLGPRTYHRRVNRVEPASVVRVTRGGLTTRRYWEFPAMAPADLTGTAAVDAVEESLADWYSSSTREYPIGTLFLSAGFDSRLSLALIHARGDCAQLLTLRHRDENCDAETAIARALVRRIGWPHDVVTPPSDYFCSSAYAQYRQRTEAVTSSWHLFIATLELARLQVKGAAWDGLLPGFLNVTDYERGGFEPYLRHLTAPGISRVRGSTAFEPCWTDEVLEEFGALLDAEHRVWPDSWQGVLGFGLRNRARLRLAVNPATILGTRAPIHLPGATRQFWNTVARIPVSERVTGKLHVRLIERLAPALLRVPIASGTKLLPAPHGAPHLHAFLRMRAAAVKQLGRPKIRRLLAAGGLAGPFQWQLCPEEAAEPPNGAIWHSVVRPEAWQHAWATARQTGVLVPDLPLLLTYRHCIAAMEEAASGAP